MDGKRGTFRQYLALRLRVGRALIVECGDFDNFDGLIRIATAIQQRRLVDGHLLLLGGLLHLLHSMAEISSDMIGGAILRSRTRRNDADRKRQTTTANAFAMRDSRRDANEMCGREE